MESELAFAQYAVQLCSMQSRLTLRQEKEAAPMLPRGGMPLMPLWVIAHEGRQIVCRPQTVTGAVRVSTGPLVPSALLERAIPLSDDLEDSACR
jgi:hypothetical protein